MILLGVPDILWLDVCSIVDKMDKLSQNALFEEFNKVAIDKSMALDIMRAIKVSCF